MDIHVLSARQRTILKDGFALFLCLLFGEQLLFNSSVITTSVRSSLALCVDTVIPSLFCFMVLTSFLSGTNLSRILSLPLLPVTRFLCLPADCGSILLMSLLGGYPVGIKALTDAYQSKQMDEKLLKRMALFCCCPAPSFVIVAVGKRLLGSQTAGILLYSSQVLAALFLGLVTSVLSVGGTRNSICRYLRKPMNKSYGKAIVESVLFTSQTLLSMCGYILLFGAFSALLEQTALPKEAVSLFSAFLEITNGCVQVAGLSLPYKISILSFFLSFGGLSVLFQLKSILGETPCSLRQLFLGRLLHGICSSVFSWILLQSFPQALEAFTPSGKPVPITDSYTPLLTGCLIGMMLILLTSMERGTERENKSSRLR